MKCENEQQKTQTGALTGRPRSGHREGPAPSWLKPGAVDYLEFPAPNHLLFWLHAHLHPQADIDITMTPKAPSPPGLIDDIVLLADVWCYLAGVCPFLTRFFFRGFFCSSSWTPPWWHCCCQSCLPLWSPRRILAPPSKVQSPQGAWVLTSRALSRSSSSRPDLGSRSFSLSFVFVFVSCHDPPRCLLLSSHGWALLKGRQWAWASQSFWISLNSRENPTTPTTLTLQKC